MSEPLQEMSWDEHYQRAKLAIEALFQLAADPVQAGQHAGTLLTFLAKAEQVAGEEEISVDLNNKLSDILERTANVLKGKPDRNYRHSWHDLPESAQAAISANILAIRQAAAALDMWWAMVQADEELGGAQIADAATLFHYMGNGASTQVTAGQLRAMFTAIYGPQELPCAP